jgi:hypothetical protein
MQQRVVRVRWFGRSEEVPASMIWLVWLAPETLYRYANALAFVAKENRLLLFRIT